jgi:two-component system response regulator FixJ
MKSTNVNPSPTPIIRVVDDDPSFRKATVRWLRASGLEVTSFASAQEFLEAPDLDAPGCVIVDLQMPEMSGLDLQAALLEAGTAMPVVFLTGQGDVPTAVRAMRGGAVDFLTKQTPQKELLAAIERALARDTKERAERAELEQLRKRFDALSVRETEVLQHVVQGKLNKQIAADLGIHERTVKLHRTAIKSKLGVPSTAELTQLWMEIQRLEVSDGTRP